MSRRRCARSVRDGVSTVAAQPVLLSVDGTPLAALLDAIREDHREGVVTVLRDGGATATTVTPNGSEKPYARAAVQAAEPRLLGVAAAAKLLGISVWTLRDLIASGKLRVVQPPGIRRIWIDRRDLDKAIEAWKS